MSQGTLRRMTPRRVRLLSLERRDKRWDLKGSCRSHVPVWTPPAELPIMKTSRGVVVFGLER